MFLPASGLAIQAALLDRRLALVLLLVLIFVLLAALVDARRHPEVALAVVDGDAVLARQVMALGGTGDVRPAALRQGARARGQLGGHGGVGRDPVRQGVLAVLNDGLGGLVSVVGGARLARGHGGVVDELQEVLPVPGDDGELLAVLAEGVELVRVRGLELLARDVGELGFGDEGLGLGADELLLEHHDLGGVGLLVLELGDLVGDLLFSWEGGLASPSV